MAGPKVSFVSISYNQEKYIHQALRGFIEQKTLFEWELIIADDGSTDKTQEIIKEFAALHPAIKPILREKNIGVQDNLNDAMRRASGQYIALCEGDDFWTDPQKIQIQTDFLDNNPDYALCFHPVRVFFEDKSAEDFIYPEVGDKTEFSTGDLLGLNFIQTNSVMYRRQNYEHLPNNILPLDWYLHLYHAQFGRIGFIPRVMSAYRRHAGGLWWDSHNDIDGIWKKYGILHMSLFAELIKLYGNNKEYRQILVDQMKSLAEKLEATDQKFGTDLIQQSQNRYPKLMKEAGWQRPSAFSRLLGR